SCVISVANKLFKAKQYKLAEAFLLSVLRRRPGEIAFWRPLGYVRLQAGDLNGARAAFEQALNQVPDDIESLGSLAGVLFLLKRPVEAVEQYQTALTLCRAQSASDSRIPELTKNLAIARKAAVEAGMFRTEAAPASPSPANRAAASAVVEGTRFTTVGPSL